MPPRNDSDFYIMNAGCLFDNKSATIEDAHAAWPGEGTMLVCRRERSYDKYSKIFVSGSGIGYDVEPGKRTSYTQDTGMGYKCQGYDLIIENVVEFNAAGEMTAHSNDVGLNEKRRVWTMK